MYQNMRAVLLVLRMVGQSKVNSPATGASLLEKINTRKGAKIQVPKPTRIVRPMKKILDQKISDLKNLPDTIIYDDLEEPDNELLENTYDYFIRKGQKPVKK